VLAVGDAQCRPSLQKGMLKMHVWHTQELGY